MISLKNVSKKYEDTIALKNVNLKFELGKVYGLVGRNGAGKTTILKIIANQLYLTEGSVEIDPTMIKNEEDIVLGRDFCFHLSNYKIKVILAIASRVYSRWDKALEEEMIDLFELDIKKQYLKASKGMQTMVSLIIALCSDATVLLLDEPYSGLDPINREVFYKLLRNKYFNEEKTVIISSHIINEIEGYFESAIIINKGDILVNSDIEAIRKKSTLVEGSKEVYLELMKHCNVLGHEKLANHYTIYLYEELSSDRIAWIEDHEGLIKTMDLQNLMIQMCMTRRGENEF